MAAELTIGRVGTDVTISDVSRLSSRARPGFQQVTIRGWLTGSTLANVNALRTELLSQARLQSLPVSVTYNADSQLDGFYLIRNIDIPLRIDQAPFARFRYPFTADLEFLGTESQVEFQSMMTGTAITNAFGIIESEAEPFHAPPQGVLSYSAGTTTVTAGSRTGSDGQIPVFFGLDFAADPTWSVTPANYLTGSCDIKISGTLRAGKEAPNDITDSTGWELSNTLVKVTPSATTGRIDVAHHDGSQWETAKTYNLKWNDTTVIPSWHYVTIVENRPERATLLLARDADEAPPTAYRHLLYMTLRRGSRLVECVYHWTGAAIVLRVQRDATEDTSVMDTATGATGSMGVRATSNDGDGNRYCIGTNVAHTATTGVGVQGGVVTTATANVHKFFIGSEIGGSGAAANDDDADLQLQWAGQFNERTRAVLR